MMYGRVSKNKRVVRKGGSVAMWRCGNVALFSYRYLSLDKRFYALSSTLRFNLERK